MRSLIVAVALSVSACAGATEDGKAAPVELVKPTAEAPYDRTFVWKPVPGATTYRVIVYNSEGQRSFEVRDVKSTSVAVKANVGLPAANYSWQVLAFRADQQISESPRTPFDIK